MSDFFFSTLFFLCLYHTVRARSLQHVRLCVTPWKAAHQAPLSTGFPRQEHWSGLLLPSPGGLPKPVVEPMASPTFSASQVDSWLLSYLGSPMTYFNVIHQFYCFQLELNHFQCCIVCHCMNISQLTYLICFTWICGLILFGGSKNNVALNILVYFIHVYASLLSEYQKVGFLGHRITKYYL